MKPIAEKPIKKIGQHASDTAELAFDQLQLPANALLGEEGEGFRYLMQELPRERLGVGAQALGAIEGALALTLEYVTQREAFGQRIGDFQNTRFTMAQIKAQLEMARAYFEQCGLELVLRHTPPAFDNEEHLNRKRKSTKRSFTSVLKQHMNSKGS